MRVLTTRTRRRCRSPSRSRRSPSRPALAGPRRSNRRGRHEDTTSRSGSTREETVAEPTVAPQAGAGDEGEETAEYLSQYTTETGEAASTSGKPAARRPVGAGHA